MTIWGKILESARTLSGPLGALFGGKAATPRGRTGAAVKPVAFTIAVIALAAKMAKADGRVTQSEIRAFREVFHIPKDELANVAHVFNLARRSTAGFEVYAGQIARIFRHDPAVLEEVLDALFHIAKADGGVLASELSYLEEVARIFRLSDKRFEQIHSAQLDDDDMDPFAILGVRRDIDDAALKRHWRKLAREHHPDALVAHGMPADFVALAAERLAKINAAYDHIRTRRGQKPTAA